MQIADLYAALINEIQELFDLAAQLNGDSALGARHISLRALSMVERMDRWRGPMPRIDIDWLRLADAAPPYGYAFRE
jgi:hypothetical protein